MPIEKVYYYKHLYLAVLAACNQLPESADATTVYTLADGDLTEATVTPQNADRYPALEVFRCLHTAETDVLRAKLAQLQRGSVAGGIADGGFIESQDVTTQGQFINAHVGRVINVEVDVAATGDGNPEIWVKGTPEAIEQVTRLNDPNYPIKLDTAKGLYAMDQGEKQLWFVGRKARVAYLTLKRPVLPVATAELIAILKTPIQAADEDASAIIEMAVSMILPNSGHMEGVGNMRLQRAMARLGMDAAGAMLPEAQVKINAKMGAE